MMKLSKNIDSIAQHFSQKNETESLHETAKMNETNRSQVRGRRAETYENLLLRTVQNIRNT
ncbi:hypothetical protein X798_07749 [Onchocerca flexuosa]|uniref:Uncharacterized protein n=1 Tax=Onchocerca flexuosa TaxID=387005 RepID=A0A238BJF1_9BILA|nr:hypothetical protein X798_07749 [Onchocerca flexuosa]